MKRETEYGLIGWVQVYDIGLYTSGLIDKLPIRPPDFASIEDQEKFRITPCSGLGVTCSTSFHGKTCDTQCKA